MAAHGSITGGIWLAGLLASATVVAQPATAPASEAAGLRRNQAMVVLDYQVLPVKGDLPIDLMGFHVYNQVADWLYLGAGMSAPLVRGAYGGFATFDIGAHVQQRLTNRLFATGGLAAGGGAGGRNFENSKSLSGTGGFVKTYVGLGYELGDFSVGANLTRVKFNRAAVGGTQANLFVQIPYTYITGPFASHGQRLSSADERQAAESSTEHMLTVVLDNYRQLKPEGSNKGSLNIVDLQYAQFFSGNRYWFASLGIGYKGLPLSNQVMGGLGQRVQLTPKLALFGQLGIGSGIYAPEIIDTGPGLLVYPKVSAEYALTRDLGLSLSAGYLAAPKGSSKNIGVGIALTRHLGVGNRGSISSSSSGPAFQAFRVSLFQETDSGVHYRDLDRGQVRMVGMQADAIIDGHWYIPLRGAAAYSTYLGYAGYGEVLAGLGLQSRAGAGGSVQAFGQLMAGTNVHGLAVKGMGGLRYSLTDRAALSITTGRIVAKSAAGNRFYANSFSLGLDYGFSMPTW